MHRAVIFAIAQLSCYSSKRLVATMMNRRTVHRLMATSVAADTVNLAQRSLRLGTELQWSYISSFYSCSLTTERISTQRAATCVSQPMSTLNFCGWWPTQSKHRHNETAIQTILHTYMYIHFEFDFIASTLTSLSRPNWVARTTTLQLVTKSISYNSTFHRPYIPFQILLSLTRMGYEIQLVKYWNK